jgi:murein DD-endopeptidase / murein LD-carboxypeptidase
MSAVVARARGCLGVRFRAQGRDPAHGLDCVGLVGVALAAELPADAPMRCGDVARVMRAATGLGVRRVEDARAGDVALFASGPGQLHLGVLSESGLIHADAVARRVVERPGAPPWPVIAGWRKEE